MDILSKLPDEILCHILSFLPTKTSVACSILSTRWKLLWTFVPVLDFDENRDRKRPRFFYKEDEEEEKEALFRQVYSLPRECPVKILRLSIQVSDSVDYVHKCFKAFSLEQLDLSVCYGTLRLFTFPKSSSYSNMLVLKLKHSFLGSVESSLFPKLKVLHLSWVSFKHEDGGSLENFLSACPILEELLCKELFNLSMTTWRIVVPTLTSLVLQCRCERHHPKSEFVLETPALEYLSIKLDATEDSLVTRTSLCNLRRADITCLFLARYKPYGFFLMKLLKNLSGVQVLKLSFEKMRCGLVDQFDYSFLNNLPVFHNLVRLELSIPSCDCVLLPRLLQKFPNLRHISINKVFDIKKEAKVRWREPRRVPICLSLTLSTFCFQGCEGFEVEVELVKYVKKHAKVLKNLIVEVSSDFKILQARVEAVHEMHKVMRGSVTSNRSYRIRETEAPTIKPQRERLKSVVASSNKSCRIRETYAPTIKPQRERMRSVVVRETEAPTIKPQRERLKSVVVSSWEVRVEKKKRKT